MKYKVGDEIIGELADYGYGGLAEFAVAPESLLAYKPANLSFEEASALPLAAGTALQALRNKADIKKGYEVLIIGSGGGVGNFSIQLAKFFGAEVTAICSTKNLELSRSLGADYVIDYTKESFNNIGKKYDSIIAVNGNYSLMKSIKSLKANGIYVMVGGAFPQIFKSLLFGWLLSLGSKKIRSLAAKPNANDLELIATLAEEKKIKPVIDSVFPFEKSGEAMSYLDKGHAQGKVVIKVE